MDRKLVKGEHVIYIDTHNAKHNALVETWHVGVKKDGTLIESLSEFKSTYGESTMPCLNLVYINPDPSCTDQYGGQKSHQSSCIHGDTQNPPRIGNYWLYPDEV